MSEFVNTVDVLGDEVLTEKIIDRSITEYKDNVITSVGQQAFACCRALTMVDLPNVTTLGAAAFSDCTALTRADLHSVTTCDNYAFMNDSALTTLILRAPSVCSLPYGLPGTPIASGTGYIYVPSSLVDSYKSDSYLKNFANQFRALEDYTVDGTITGELDPTKI